MTAEHTVARREQELAAARRLSTTSDEPSPTRTAEQVPHGDALPCARSLKRIPESALAARTLVTDTLASWDLRHLTDDAVLIVTELVSNAVAHASGPDMRVSVVRVDARRVRVSVIDADRTRPQPRPFDVERERGRGLLLIEAMSCTWGVHLLHGGKAVWAELEAS